MLYPIGHEEAALLLPKPDLILRDQNSDQSSYEEASGTFRRAELHVKVRG